MKKKSQLRLFDLFLFGRHSVAFIAVNSRCVVHVWMMAYIEKELLKLHAKAWWLQDPVNLKYSYMCLLSSVISSIVSALPLYPWGFKMAGFYCTKVLQNKTTVCWLSTGINTVLTRLYLCVQSALYSFVPRTLLGNPPSNHRLCHQHLLLQMHWLLGCGTWAIGRDDCAGCVWLINAAVWCCYRTWLVSWSTWLTGPLEERKRLQLLLGIGWWSEMSSHCTFKTTSYNVHSSCKNVCKMLQSDAATALDWCPDQPD